MHQVCLSKLKQVEIILWIFSDHKGIAVGVNDNNNRTLVLAIDILIAFECSMSH